MFSRWILVNISIYIASQFVGMKKNLNSTTLFISFIEKATTANSKQFKIAKKKEAAALYRLKYIALFISQNQNVCGVSNCDMFDICDAISFRQFRLFSSI